MLDRSLAPGQAVQSKSHVCITLEIVVCNTTRLHRHSSLLVVGVPAKRIHEVQITNKNLTSPHLGVYLYARNIKKNMSSIMRTANMKNSDAWSRAFAEATMMTMMLPKATVSSQAACTTDFIESGA